ncbi:PAS domain-containing protein [Halobacterium jilantaiense]|uniref:PAS domain S-box-containing protein n=1 Tax=Halobacterium jilantaiense TaxID=355548 RepID=A0A1I0MH35_9EURY|nr:PAS domain-containing protein [Halobacterium jilantaiense]SEV87685.1 PAS domain S-box-containing protein [Halobacterium jilantaiense]
MSTLTSEQPAVAYVASTARSRAAGERALARHGTEPVAAAADADAAVEAVAAGADCVVVEQTDDPPGTDALGALAAVRRADPAVPVVVFERERAASIAADAIDFDVTEYVRESDAADESALAAVAEAAERAADSYRAEQEVAMVNDLARTVYERVTDGFLALDDDWTVTYLNAAAEDILGVDREDVLGERLWAAFPEATDYAFHREYHRAMTTQEPVAFRERFPPLDETFEVRVFPADDGLSVHFRTITEGESPARGDDPLLELANVVSADLSASLDRVRSDLVAVEEHCGCESDALADALASVDRMTDLVARAEALAAGRPADWTNE